MSGIGVETVAAARAWIGTPYRHQASVLGAGTDCLGLVRGVWRALYGAEPEAVLPYTQDWAEVARDEVLWASAGRHLTEVAEGVGEPGDVLLFRMRDGMVAKHLGIAATREGMASFIHAYSGHAVTESPLSEPWRRRIVARFRFPERTN